MADGTKHPRARKHHFVPAGYLAGFATPSGRDGQLFVFDIKRRRQWFGSPDNVAAERDLYAVEGDEPEAVESALSRSESELLSTLARIGVAQGGKGVTQADAATVAAFVALQSLRDPAQLDSIRDFYAELATMTLQLATQDRSTFEAESARMAAAAPDFEWDLPTYEEARDAIRDGDFRFQPGSSTVVSSAFSPLRDVFRTIVTQRSLVFLRGKPGEELITSSSPVLLTGEGTRGFANAEEILMPLNSRLLFMAVEGEPGSVHEGIAPPGLFGMVNFELARKSEQLYGMRETVMKTIEPFLRAEAAVKNSSSHGD